MDKALQTMIENMPEKTGKSLIEWKTILEKKNFEKHGEAMAFLKGEHDVTHGFANMIIQLSKEENISDQALIAQQYKGKENLIPMYEKLINLICTLGEDITIAPKKTTVSLVRKKQFALIKPATKTRIDLGLKLKDTPETKRLGNSGPFGTMCTHRVQLHHFKEIDAELKAWLKEAYLKSN